MIVSKITEALENCGMGDWSAYTLDTQGKLHHIIGMTWGVMKRNGTFIDAESRNFTFNPREGDKMVTIFKVEN